MSPDGPVALGTERWLFRLVGVTNSLENQMRLMDPLQKSVQTHTDFCL